MSHAATLRMAALIGLPLLLADFVSKRVVEALLVPHRAYEVLGDVVRFRLVYNRGAAMGIPVGDARWLMAGVSAAVLVALVIMLMRTAPSHRRTVTALAVLIAGAVGNLIDRLANPRGVVDFIDAGIGAARFWTFNVADASVTAGVLLLLLFPDRQSPAPPPPPAPPPAKG